MVRFLPQLVHHLLPEGAVHLGVHHAGRDAVDPDAGRSNLLRQRLGQTDNTRLCRRIRHLAGGSGQSPDGGGGDDAAAVPVNHRRQHRTAAVKGTVQVDRHHPSPVLRCKIGQQSLPGNSGIAHQHVDVSKLLQNRLHHLLHLLRVGHICLTGQHRASLLCHLLGKFFDRLPATAKVCSHLIACFCKFFCGCPPDPAGSSCNERHLCHPVSLRLCFFLIKQKGAGIFQRLFLGDLSETRTPDTLIKSQVLYRLS